MLFIILIGAAVAGAVVLLVAYAFTTTEARISGRSGLKAIESYTWQNDEIVAKEKSFYERVINPISGKSTSLARRFTPVGYVEGARKKLQLSGRRGPEELDRFLAIRALTIGVIPFIGIFLAVLPGMEAKNRVFMFLLIGFALVVLPDANLNKQVQSRQKKIRQSLPDVLDLLTISVEAGLGFEQAVDRITDSVPGPLSDEFNRMIGEMRAGSNRVDALQALEARTGLDEMKSFVMSLVQADTFGVSIGRVLRAQADEMRIKRRQLAQEAAQKAPVKMLLPMTFFIFPALFVVVLGPAIVSIAQNFK